MRLIVQRVQRAAVRVGGEGAAEIGPGLAILVGGRTTDTAGGPAAGGFLLGGEPLPSGPSRCRLHARRRGSGTLRGGPARPSAEKSYPHGRRGPAAAAGPRGRKRRSRH